MSRKYLALCSIVYRHTLTSKRITALPQQIVEGIDPEVAAQLVQNMQLRPLTRGEQIDRGLVDIYEPEAGAQFNQRTQPVETPIVETSEPEDGEGDDGGDSGDDSDAETGDETGAQETEEAKASDPETAAPTSRRRRSPTVGA